MAAELVTVFKGAVRANSDVEPIVVVGRHRVLAGRVLDMYGAGLAGARVAFTPPEGFQTRFDAVLDTTLVERWVTLTDEHGGFALERVPVISNATLEASLDGFERSTIAAPGHAERALVITLAPPGAGDRIRGRVVDRDNRPVAAARVSNGVSSAATDSAGEFLLDRDGAPDADELIAVAAGALPARYSAQRDGEGQPVFPPYVVLTLGAQPLTLSGRIVDADGQPRPDVMIWIDDPTAFGGVGDGMTGQVEYMITAEPTADEESLISQSAWSWVRVSAAGEFTIEGLLERDYRLRAIDDRTLEAREFGPFAAGSSELELVWPVPAPQLVSGRVTSRSGQALAGVHVALNGHCFGGHWHGNGAVMTGDDGTFEFSGIGANRLSLWLRGDDVVPQLIQLDGPQQDVEIELAVRCHFKLRLRDAASADRMRVEDADGQKLSLYKVDPHGVTTMSSVSFDGGSTSALGVDDSARTLILERDGREVARIPLELRTGELNVIEY